MKCSKGALSLPAIMDFEEAEFVLWMEAAEEIERQIAQAMKGK